MGIYKIAIISFAVLFIGELGNAQENEVDQKVVDDACKCISEIDRSLVKITQYEQIKECIESSNTTNQLLSSLTAINKEIKSNDSLVIDGKEVKKEYNVTLDMGKNYKDIQESLLRNCPSMKSIMTSQNEISDLSISDKEKAKALYDEGMESYRSQNIDQAISLFKKAIKKDRKFAWAWDMLGISYRKQNEFKKAIKAYDKSIALDPEGRMPLMNRPIANLMLENYSEAISDYKKFIEIFPDDPEGFYGIGRVYAIQGNYEEALDNTMKAYIMYNAIDSPYARDAEKNLALYYKTLKDNGSLEIWDKVAKKHDIKIGG